MMAMIRTIITRASGRRTIAFIAGVERALVGERTMGKVSWPAGHALADWILERGDAAGEFTYPTGIAVADGRGYTTERMGGEANRRVQVLSLDGAPLQELLPARYGRLQMSEEEMDAVNPCSSSSSSSSTLVVVAAAAAAGDGRGEAMQ